MDIETYVFRTLFGVTVIFALPLSYILWKNRDRKEVYALFGTTIGSAIWAFALLIQTFTDEFWYMQMFRVVYLGVMIVTPALFIFALAYTGREKYINKKLYVLLLIHPVYTVIGITLNPYNFFLEQINTTDAVIPFYMSFNLGHDIHLLYSYGLIFISVVLIADFIFKSSHTIYRGQAFSLAVGMSSPVLINILYVFQPFGVTPMVDVTPIGMIIGIIAFSVAVFKYKFTNIKPIAKNKIIDSASDGILVVDTNGNINEANPRLKEIFEHEKITIGDDISSFIEIHPNLEEAYERLTEEENVSEETVTYSNRYIKITTEPINDSHNELIGWLLLFRDITEHIQRERELEQQVQKLDKFAAIVSHDLRNPLNVAYMRTEQTKATEETKHLDDTLKALDRMEQIIKDVLELTKSNGKINMETTDLQLIAKEAWLNVETGDAELELTDEVKETMIIADPDNTKRLFENLIRNSIEHGARKDDEGNPITKNHNVRIDVVDIQPDSVSITVEDNGCGIPENKRELIFEDGYTTGGTGLGLTIVEEIANISGWDVNVTDTELGGVAFKLTNVSTPVHTAAKQR